MRRSQSYATSALEVMPELWQLPDGRWRSCRPGAVWLAVFLPVGIPCLSTVKACMRVFRVRYRRRVLPSASLPYITSCRVDQP